MSIIIFIIVLVALILVHEFGHFISAKKLGMRVDEFGIGFPPKIISWIKGETRYSINSIPLGGFVSIFGEDSEANIEDSPDKHRAFSNKPRWSQAIVLFSGVFFNILFAWALFSLVFSIGMEVPANYSSPFGELEKKQVAIVSVLEESPAEKSGLKEGDIIKNISLNETSLEEMNTESITNFISSHGGKELTVTYTRNEELKSAKLTPTKLEEAESDAPAIGAMLSGKGVMQITPPLSVAEGARFTGIITYKTVNAFGGLITNAIIGEADLSQVAGPVGIVNFTSRAYEAGILSLLSFVGFISVNLAIINMVPFPALDGGRLFMLAIEGTRRKSLNPKFVKIANLTGFALLILLMILVTYNDIIRLVGT